MIKSNLCECESCGARIMWKKTVNDKWIPVDFDQSQYAPTQFDRTKMTAHFATCPNADKHRKDKS